MEHTSDKGIFKALGGVWVCENVIFHLRDSVISRKNNICMIQSTFEKCKTQQMQLSPTVHTGFVTSNFISKVDFFTLYLLCEMEIWWTFYQMSGFKNRVGASQPNFAYCRIQFFEIGVKIRIIWMFRNYTESATSGIWRLTLFECWLSFFLAMCLYDCLCPIADLDQQFHFGNL